mmetsp:Transcript_678/g.1161  ORF Transcript_678/g.1161 Transcript_678/m.1161 type:complete len:92 (-) Transcript_678:212-487(-)
MGSRGSRLLLALHAGRFLHQSPQKIRGRRLWGPVALRAGLVFYKMLEFIALCVSSSRISVEEWESPAQIVIIKMQEDVSALIDNRPRLIHS